MLFNETREFSLMLADANATVASYLNKVLSRQSLLPLDDVIVRNFVDEGVFYYALIFFITSSFPNLHRLHIILIFCFSSRKI